MWNTPTAAKPGILGGFLRSITFRSPGSPGGAAEAEQLVAGSHVERFRIRAVKIRNDVAQPSAVIHQVARGVGLTTDRLLALDPVAVDVVGVVVALEDLTHRVPGKEEMVEGDFEAVVKLLSQIEVNHSSSIQLLVAISIPAICGAT